MKGDIEAVVLEDLVVALADVLRRLSSLRERQCWCAMAVGNPMVRDHSELCRTAQTLLRHAEQVRD